MPGNSLPATATIIPAPAVQNVNPQNTNSSQVSASAPSRCSITSSIGDLVDAVLKDDKVAQGSDAKVNEMGNRLTVVKVEVRNLRADIDRIQSEFKDEIRRVQAEVRDEIHRLRAEVKSEIQRVQLMAQQALTTAEGSRIALDILKPR